MNKLQRRALLHVMASERKDDSELERERFKTAMIAANPSKVHEILRMFEDMDRDSEEQSIEQFVPQSADEVQQVLSDLQRFGISLRDGG